MPEPVAQLDMTQLVQEYSVFLYRLAVRLTGSPQDAEDLVQQTFLAAQRYGSQVRDPARMRSWLATVLRNGFRRSLRKRQHGSVVSLDDVGELADDAWASDQELDGNELQAALDELSADYREVLVLFYLEQKSYREIADSLSVPIGTVMSRLSRGKAWLRKRLQTSALLNGENPL